jgi:hypothetical protein
MSCSYPNIETGVVVLRFQGTTPVKASPVLCYSFVVTRYPLWLIPIRPLFLLLAKYNISTKDKEMKLLFMAGYFV